MAMTQQKRLDLARRTDVHPLVYSLLLRAKGLDILQDGEWVDEYIKTQLVQDVYYPIPGNHLNHKSPFDWS